MTLKEYVKLTNRRNTLVAELAEIDEKLDKHDMAQAKTEAQQFAALFKQNERALSKQPAWQRTNKVPHDSKGMQS